MNELILTLDPPEEYIRYILYKEFIEQKKESTIDVDVVYTKDLIEILD